MLSWENIIIFGDENYHPGRHHKDLGIQKLQVLTGELLSSPLFMFTFANKRTKISSHFEFECACTY